MPVSRAPEASSNLSVSQLSQSPGQADANAQSTSLLKSTEPVYPQPNSTSAAIRLEPRSDGQGQLDALPSNNGPYGHPGLSMVSTVPQSVLEAADNRKHQKQHSDDTPSCSIAEPSGKPISPASAATVATEATIATASVTEPVATTEATEATEATNQTHGATLTSNSSAGDQAGTAIAGVSHDSLSLSDFAKSAAAAAIPMGIADRRPVRSCRAEATPPKKGPVARAPKRKRVQSQSPVTNRTKAGKAGKGTTATKSSQKKPTAPVQKIQYCVNVDIGEWDEQVSESPHCGRPLLWLARDAPLATAPCGYILSDYCLVLVHTISRARIVPRLCSLPLCILACVDARSAVSDHLTCVSLPYFALCSRFMPFAAVFPSG